MRQEQRLYRQEQHACKADMQCCRHSCSTCYFVWISTAGLAVVYGINGSILGCYTVRVAWQALSTYGGFCRRACRAIQICLAINSVDTIGTPSLGHLVFGSKLLPRSHARLFFGAISAPVCASTKLAGLVPSVGLNTSLPLPLLPRDGAPVFCIEETLLLLDISLVRRHRCCSPS